MIDLQKINPDELQNIVIIVQIVQSFCSIVIGFATIGILLLINNRSQALARQSMVAGVLADLNARFSRNWEMRARPEVKDDPIVYYTQFWSLELDAFEAWRRETVPDDIFRFWADERYRDWHADQPLGRMSYKKGFQEVVGNWNHPKFKMFYETLHRTGVEAAIARIRPESRMFGSKSIPPLFDIAADGKQRLSERQSSLHERAAPLQIHDPDLS